MNNERRPPSGQRDLHGLRRPGPIRQGGHEPSGPGPRRRGGGPRGPYRGGPRRPGGEKYGLNRPRRREAEEPESDEILSGRLEANYLKELVSGRTPIEVKLRNGETHSGTIEYWDQRFIRLTPVRGPNLFIFKHDIKYFMEK